MAAAFVKLQKWEHPLLDVLLASVASIVSVEFYTAFLPLLFWVLTLNNSRVVVPLLV